MAAEASTIIAFPHPSILAESTNLGRQSQIPTWGNTKLRRTQLTAFIRSICQGRFRSLSPAARNITTGNRHRIRRRTGGHPLFQQAWDGKTPARALLLISPGLSTEAKGCLERSIPQAPTP